MVPIVFSTFGDPKLPHFENATRIHMHIHHTHNMNFIDTNGDVPKGRYIMMDDVYLYHAHTFFSMCNMCVGSNGYLSILIEHELTNRALESYQWMSSNAWFAPHTSATQDLSRRAHRHLAKVNSFYFGNHSILLKDWLLFDCCFAFIVSLL